MCYTIYDFGVEWGFVMTVKGFLFYIGNWTAISNHYEHDDANNVIHANAELLDCHDCIVFSHDKEKLITGIDLHGLVVVQTPDATLVAPANSTAKIKELLKQLSTKTEKQKFL